MTVALNDLPERPVSAHPNFVTAEGLGLIEHRLASAQQTLGAARAAGDRDAQAALRQAIDYWTTRRATAQVMPRPADRTQVRFGAAVTVEDQAGARRTWRIVGEDEAQAQDGAMAYVEPLAQALMGRRVGETVEAEGQAWRVAAIG